MVSEEAVLKALDKPRKLFSIRQVTDPSGSDEALQIPADEDEGRRQGRIRHQERDLAEALDHDAFSSNRAEGINVFEFNQMKHDAKNPCRLFGIML